MMSAIASPMPGISAEAALSDDLIERKAQREEIVCRACIGFRPERIAAAERAPLPEFPEQGGNRGCIGRGHFGSMRARANRRAPLLSSLSLNGLAPGPHK